MPQVVPDFLPRQQLLRVFWGKETTASKITTFWYVMRRKTWRISVKRKFLLSRIIFGIQHRAEIAGNHVSMNISVMAISFSHLPYWLMEKIWKHWAWPPCQIETGDFAFIRPSTLVKRGYVYKDTKEKPFFFLS